MDEQTREDLAIYIARHLWMAEKVKTFKEYAEFVDAMIVSWEFSRKWGHHRMLSLDDVTEDFNLLTMESQRQED